jgi:hypothetical protein
MTCAGNQLDGFGVESHAARDMLHRVVEDAATIRKAGVVMRDQVRFLLVSGFVPA